MVPSWTTLRAIVLCAQQHVPEDRLVLAMSIATGGRSFDRGGAGPEPDEDLDADATRLRALVELASAGDTEAFGQLYDHYLPGIYRFTYYRVSSRVLAEDLTSETFTRALRSIGRFEWQGKDFGAWLTTIARNLVADH